MAFSAMSFSGLGVKENDDFSETSWINVKFLGESIRFDARRHKVRCTRNYFKRSVENPRSAQIRSITLRFEEKAALGRKGQISQNHRGSSKGGVNATERHPIWQTVHKFKN